MVCASLAPPPTSATDHSSSVKVRRGGVGTHFVIHKYFFERSPSWQAIREEELRAQEGEKAKATQPTDDDPAMNDWHNLDFSPIDARHLSSYPLVRNRVVSLLKASRNHMHPTTNLLIRIVRTISSYAYTQVDFV